MNQKNGEIFNIPQQLVPVKVKLLSQDETIRSPFKDEPVLVSIGKGKVNSQLVQLSTHHGRALDDERVAGKVVWTDEYHTPFGDRDFKGNMFEQLGVEPDGNSFFKYHVIGLKESIGVNRIDRVSKIMRNLGLPTEAIKRVYLLEEVIYKGERMPIEEWEKIEINNRVAKYNELITNSETSAAASSLKYETEKILAMFESTKFYVIERHLQTDVRLRDLREAKSEESFHQLVDVPLIWLTKNVLPNSNLNRGFVSWELGRPEDFDPTNKDHLTYYFSDWLPKQMATYLAKFHSNEMVDGYAHGQNWSMVGTLYDLDSFFGVPIGDPNPEAASLQNDVMETTKAIVELLAPEGVGFGKWLSKRFDGGNNHLSREFPDLLENALYNFEVTYIENRFSEALAQPGEDIDRYGMLYYIHTRNFSVMSDGRDIDWDTDSRIFERVANHFCPNLAESIVRKNKEEN